MALDHAVEERCRLVVDPTEVFEDDAGRLILFRVRASCLDTRGRWLLEAFQGRCAFYLLRPPRQR
jgi:hypothetical protein